MVRGVIDKYVLRAYREGDPRSPRVPSATSELVGTSTLTGKGDSSGSIFYLFL